ncbi:hypothetical protein CRUP_024661 [Coryphaenoides rupestris]|nr:hypothetical protein CRUP_024661 [Coryphaenoides rupestris]
MCLKFPQSSGLLTERAAVLTVTVEAQKPEGPLAYRRKSLPIQVFIFTVPSSSVPFYGPHFTWFPVVKTIHKARRHCRSVMRRSQ